MVARWTELWYVCSSPGCFNVWSFTAYCLDNPNCVKDYMSSRNASIRSNASQYSGSEPGTRIHQHTWFCWVIADKLRVKLLPEWGIESLPSIDMTDTGGVSLVGGDERMLCLLASHPGYCLIDQICCRSTLGMYALLSTRCSVAHFTYTSAGCYE